jgi:hypothetical protein
MQQKTSHLRPLVGSDSYTGKNASIVEQFGVTTALRKTTRNSDTPVIDVPQAKRWVSPQDWEWASLIDAQDKLRMIIDPTSPYAQAGAAAMNRAIDSIILAAFWGTAYTGEDGTTSETFDTTNYQVGVNVGGTASALNVPKLQSAVQKLIAVTKGELSEAVSGVISSYEHDSLLKEVQINNVDYGGGAVLVDGRVKRFMGIDFTVYEDLDISSGNRRIPIFLKSGMHLGVWNDLNTKVSERADKSYAWQVYLCGTFGATRTQAGKIIQVLCDDQI